MDAAPYIDDDGTRWLNPTTAAEVVKNSTPTTLANWAAVGKTPFGLRLKSKRVPLLMTSHISDGCFYKPRRPRRDRPVIAEESVIALATIFREVFHDKRRERRGGYSKEEITALRSATKRYGVQKPLHVSNP